MRRYIHSQRFRADSSYVVRYLLVFSFYPASSHNYEDHVVTVMVLIRGVEVRMKYSGIINRYGCHGGYVCVIEVTFLWRPFSKFKYRKQLLKVNFNWTLTSFFPIIDIFFDNRFELTTFVETVKRRFTRRKKKPLSNYRMSLEGITCIHENVSLTNYLKWISQLFLLSVSFYFPFPALNCIC